MNEEAVETKQLFSPLLASYGAVCARETAEDFAKLREEFEQGLLRK